MGALDALRMVARALGPEAGELGRVNAFIGPSARAGWEDLGGSQNAVDAFDELGRAGASKYDIWNDPRTSRMFQGPGNSVLRETPTDSVQFRADFQPVRHGEDEVVQRILYGQNRAGESLRFGDVVDYPELQYAYPTTRQFRFDLANGDGGSVGIRNTGIEPTLDDITIRAGRSTFSTGKKNSRMWEPGPLFAHEGTHAGVQLHGEGGGLFLPDYATVQQSPLAMTLYAKRIKDLTAARNRLEAMAANETQPGLGEAARQIQNEIDHLRRVGGPSESLSQTLRYLNSASERMAFNAGARYSMSPAERMAKPPWVTDGNHTLNGLDPAWYHKAHEGNVYGTAYDYGALNLSGVKPYESKPPRQEVVDMLRNYSRFLAGGGGILSALEIARRAGQEEAY